MNAVACDHNYVKTKDKGIREKLKKGVCNCVLAILTTYIRPSFRNLMLFFRGRDHTIVSAKYSS